MTNFQINRIKRIKQSLLFIFAFICITAPKLWPVNLEFNPETGSTYNYQHSGRHESKSYIFNQEFTEKNESFDFDFQVKVIDFQNDSFIVDITRNQNTFRRYLKSDFIIAGAPSEVLLPLVITLPDKDWKKGTQHNISSRLNLGRFEVPAQIDLLLKDISKEKNTAEIWFAGKLNLPQDRLRKKSFSVKGKIFFDLKKRVIRKADWYSEYSFNIINKEFAVTRDLWKIQLKTTNTVQLKGIDK
ncbi:MAG: hypothetical protein ACQETH_01190 [Candidatus Rifleibacteriota bacterium]